jgi:acyl-CoA synthetase (AMP-forming)/AMP-acid ligase II
VTAGTQRSARNLYDRFGRRARQQPDAAAVRDPGGKDLTYGDLERQAAAVAASLESSTEPGTASP